MSQVKKGDKVKVHYTGKLNDGKVFDSSEGREPLEFEVGAGQMIPGFDKGVEGMGLNEKKTIVIPAHEAYGDIREDLIQEVSKKRLPKEIEPKVGMSLMSQTPDGREIQLMVKEVKDDSIVVDANHALAGKELSFDVEIVTIN